MKIIPLPIISVLQNLFVLYTFTEELTYVDTVGCRHIYMQRQPLVELFDNIYYNRTVYTDVVE
jgi:hypothetical protein